MTPPDSGEHRAWCSGGRIDRHGTRLGCDCKPDSGEREVRSPEYDALLRQAVEENQAEQRKLAAMTPAQRDEYIREWAARIAPGLCADATAHDREMNTPWISIPLPFAQRVLAALEDIDTQEVRAIRAELRARLPR